jgi:alcohol dehydrogenase
MVISVQTVNNIISGLGSIVELKNLLNDFSGASAGNRPRHHPRRCIAHFRLFESQRQNYTIYSSVQADPAAHIVLDGAVAQRQQADLILGWRRSSWMSPKCLRFWRIRIRNSSCRIFTAPAMPSVRACR